MPTVTIESKGCRDCSLCVDICPTKVFDRDEASLLAVVARPADCIGCTSCQYLCPSRCLTVGDFEAQRPFFRIEENAAFVERFLQQKPVSARLTEADMDEALRDVSVRLKALSDSITETMGRGQRAVGRKAGALAASHLPEMYEGTTLRDVLDRMSRRFAGSFDFEASLAEDGSQITMRFPGCALGRVVTAHGEKIGSATLCATFHEYWAGLIGSFTNRNYGVDMLETGAHCTMKLQVRG